MNQFYLLRHGEVDVDPSKPASELALSDRGRNSALKLVDKGIFANADLIYISEEKKAYSTAEIIADSLGKKVLKLSNFNELNRNKAGFLENYDSAVKEAFTYPSQSRNSWEPCTEALKRFRKGIGIINKKHKNKKILIVSHGIVLTLYFAYLKRQMTHLFSRWKKLSFLSYGIVEDSVVVKDITA